MGKIISFRGIEKSDIPYYIAKSLAGNNFKVACIDNSYTNDLFESVHKFNNDDANYITKENIVYIKNATVDDKFINSFDYIILYLGENARTFASDISLIITSFAKSDIYKLYALDAELLSDSYFILRNKVSNKVTEKSFALDFEINAEQILGSLPLDLKDEAGYQNFTYEGRTRISELSQEMQYCIMTILGIITGDDIKTIKRYYKKGKRSH